MGKQFHRRTAGRVVTRLLRPLGALALSALLMVPALSGCDSSSALYYRITTDLETEGSPFQLEVVVQCRNMQVLRSGAGARLSYLQRPYLYGRPTAAGHAVLMRVPDFCGMLDSANERVKAALERFEKEGPGLPLVLWVPDKDVLDHMTAYTSLKGYEGPGSTLRYRGTRFARATQEEWQTWMQREEKPFVTRANDPVFSWNAKGQRGPGNPPVRCAGLRLKPIPPTWREEVRRAWPADRPLAWSDEGLWKQFTSGDFRDRPENRDLYPDQMAFIGTQKVGFDTLPFKSRNARAEHDPIVAAFPKFIGASINDVDLDVVVRGRADCRRGALSGPPEIWLVAKGGKTGRVGGTSLVIIDDDFVFTSGKDSRIILIEGSHEDMYP